MLWQLLASFFRSGSLRFGEHGASVWPLTAASFLQTFICAALLSSCAVSNEDLGGSRSAASGTPGSRITPPSPAGERDTDSEGTALGRRFLEDPDASSYEYDPVRLPSGQTVEEQRQQEMRARTTDAEIGAVEGGLGSPLDPELGRIERELDLETTLPAEKVPSFTAGTKKVKRLFKRRHFEDALVETNYLLEFYPRSPQLLMMKGTLHQKLEQIDLALSAYREAYFIRPHRKLQAQIRYLEFRVADRERLKRGNGRAEGVVTPEGVEKIESTYPGFDGLDEPALSGESPATSRPGVQPLPQAGGGSGVTPERPSGTSGSGSSGENQSAPGKGN